MRSLIIVVVVAAAFVAACSTRTGPAVVDEDPVVPIATTGKPDKEGAAIWRKACETIHAAELAVLQKKIDAGDKKAQTAADDVMLSCLEGFMAMPDAASNMAAPRAFSWPFSCVIACVFRVDIRAWISFFRY